MFFPADRSRLRSTLLHYPDKDPRIFGSAAADWTARTYAQHQALRPLALPRLPPPRQLASDLAFVPASDFRALAPTFLLISGEAQAPSTSIHPLQMHSSASPGSTPSTPVHLLPETNSGKPNL